MYLKKNMIYLKCLGAHSISVGNQFTGNDQSCEVDWFPNAPCISLLSTDMPSRSWKKINGHNSDTADQ